MHLLQYSPVTQNENWKRGGKGSFLLAKNNILILKKRNIDKSDQRMIYDYFVP